MAATSSAPKTAHLTLQGLRMRFSRSPEAGALVGFLAVLIFFSITAGDLFLSPDSASSVLTSQAVSGIVAVGVAFLMISGEFDLSVGSILGVTSMAFMSLIMSNVPVVLSAIIAIMAGAAMGLLNGLILVWTRIPSFIVTLGTLQAYRAIALVGIKGGGILRYADYSATPPMIYVHPLVIIAFCLVILFLLFLGRRIIINYWRELRRSTGLGRLSPALRLLLVGGSGLLLIFGAVAIIFGQLRDLATLVPVNFFDLLNGRFSFITVGNFRTALVWWLLTVAIFTVILTQTRYGNATYATGGNPGAALAQGILVDRVRVINFVISGTLSGFAGVVAVGRELNVFPLAGLGLELEVIAASVIGGTLLSGGFGSIIGATLGVLITGILRTGLVLTKIGGQSVPAELFQGILGVILIATVVLNTAVRRMR
jgi:ribose/xylose/arabinose/galactoside ABC-type transport system permease subunit